MMRRSLLPAAFLLVPALLSAQRDPCRNVWGDDSRARVCEVRNLGAKATGALRIDPGANGGAEVEVWDRDSIGVEARVLSYARNEDDATALQRQITVTLVQGVLTAEGPRTRDPEGWAVIFKVKVPRTQDLDIETSNGPIGVAGVTGTLRLQTTNGPVTLDRVNGDVRARLQNGPLTVAFGGSGWQGAGLDAETTNGPLTLEIPSDYNAVLETGTVNGPLDAQIPITVQGNLGRGRRSFTTTLGRGGVTLRAKTTNGPLTLARAR
ncbi:MAG TPA: hypothetical protein VFI13_08805 [Gemmatimonadales bacterium]|nr:hypothetical protein [Gemmatimonadales bacterium]